MKFWVEDIVRPRVRYQVATPVSENTWSDKTNDIISIDKYGEQIIGYKRARDLIKQAVSDDTLIYTTWATYDDTKKDVAVKWIAAPYALRVAHLGSDSVDAYNWDYMTNLTRGIDISTLGGRALIVELMRRRVSHNLRKEILTKSDLDAFWDDTEKLFRGYIDANSPDFKNWLISTEFEGKVYWSQQLEDDLLNIYNGYY